MSQQELLIAVVDILERLRIPYFLTGSWASSLQGEPRSTHDLDLVVAITSVSAAELFGSFPAPDFYLSEVAMQDAIRDRTMFNLLDNRAGDKVDFWILTDDPWDHERFSRRIQIDVFGRTVFVTTPEDTILGKLRWAELSGGSEKQFTDALRVFEVQSASLDCEYIESWSKRLGIERLWNRLKRQAEIAGDSIYKNKA